MLNKHITIALVFISFSTFFYCKTELVNLNKYQQDDISILKNIVSNARISLNDLKYYNKIEDYSNDLKNRVCFNSEGFIIALSLEKTEFSNMKLLGSLAQLKYLNLRTNKITKIEGIDNLQNLNDLILPKNKISKVENIEKLKSLHTLDLSSNKISGDVNFEGLNKLKVLFIFNNNIEIFDFKGLSNLRWLFASHNKIKEIRNIRLSPKLSDLNLYGNPIYNVEGFEHLKKLKNVYLSRENVSEHENYNNIIKKLKKKNVKVITAPDVFVEPLSDVYD